MNAKPLLILLLSFFWLSSCSDDKSVNNDNQYSVNVNNDIKSFNIETGELVLKSGQIFSEVVSSIEPFQKKVGLYSTTTFYLDGNPIFESIPIQPEYASSVHNDLTFVFVGSKFYLLDGSPSLESLGPNKSTSETIREENTQKRKASWDKFIKYLQNAGKLVE